MSEPRLNTLYVFPRPTRHRHNDTPDEAVTIPNTATLRIIRQVYRDQRTAGVNPIDARLRLWLLLAERCGRTVVERIDLP